MIRIIMTEKTPLHHITYEEKKKISKNIQLKFLYNMTQSDLTNNNKNKAIS